MKECLWRDEIFLLTISWADKTERANLLMSGSWAEYYHLGNRDLHQSPAVSAEEPSFIAVLKNSDHNTQICSFPSAWWKCHCSVCTRFEGLTALLISAIVHHCLHLVRSGFEWICQTVLHTAWWFARPTQILVSCSNSLNLVWTEDKWRENPHRCGAGVCCIII